MGSWRAAKPISGYYTNDHEEIIHGATVVRRDGAGPSRSARGLREDPEGQTRQRAEAHCSPAGGAEDFPAVLRQRRALAGPPLVRGGVHPGLDDQRLPLLHAASPCRIEARWPYERGRAATERGATWQLQREGRSGAGFRREAHPRSPLGCRRRHSKPEVAFLGSRDRGPRSADWPGELDQPLHRSAGRGPGISGGGDLIVEKRRGLENNSLVSHPPRHPLAVEIFQQRYRILARHPEQVLEEIGRASCRE